MADARLVRQLEDHFRRITLTIYDTRIPAPEADAVILPYLDEGVSFVDPWQLASGLRKYRLGLAGFHAMLSFDFEIFQLGVTLNEQGDAGRAIVDGVMQLKLLRPVLTYPLRTIITYDFVVTDPGDENRDVGFRIKAHEEMWSFADMIANVPGTGWLYTNLFRRGFAWAFLGASWLSSRARGVLPK